VVPATMALLGKWNWYLPSWLNWLPELHVEGDPDTVTRAGEAPERDATSRTPVSV